MGNFVQCTGGTWVNLDLIAKIVPVREGDRIRAYQFFVTTGEIAGEVLHSSFDPIYAAPVVPALPGEAMLEFYSRSTEKRPESISDIVIIEMPIFGWRCSQSRATPVTYRPYFDRGASMYLYRLSDGRYQDERGLSQSCFTNLDDAESYVLKRLQSKWDESS